LLGLNPGVHSLIVLPGVASGPNGDAVQFDLVPNSANQVLGQLRALGLDRTGSVAVDSVDVDMSSMAAVEDYRVLDRESAPIWDMVEATIRSQGSYPPSFFALFVIAGLIGAVGILTNSEILIVGAMVVCPDYGPVANVALGIQQGDARRIWRAVGALIIGFSSVVLASFVFALLIRAAQLESQSFQVGIRPVSRLINTPNVFSVVVAVLAGIVGIVSLTESRTNALIGVFISVTTIPAAADMGVSLAFGNWNEALGSTFQLLLNVGLLMSVGAAVLSVQRSIWSRLTRVVRQGR
jgi:uncharacterized hydrophobic protein (TIGR00271 family)